MRHHRDLENIMLMSIDVGNTSPLFWLDWVHFESLGAWDGQVAAFADSINGFFFS